MIRKQPCSQKRFIPISIYCANNIFCNFPFRFSIEEEFTFEKSLSRRQSKQNQMPNFSQNVGNLLFLLVFGKECGLSQLN